jgi:hypothetical protein
MRCSGRAKHRRARWRCRERVREVVQAERRSQLDRVLKAPLKNDAKYLTSVDHAEFLSAQRPR